MKKTPFAEKLFMVIGRTSGSTIDAKERRLYRNIRKSYRVLRHATLVGVFFRHVNCRKTVGLFMRSVLC